MSQDVLSFYFLNGTNLSNANLSNANLIRANLSNANLKNANLKCANLITANLIRANLSNVNLSNANLKCANLITANLSNANLKNAYLEETDLKRTNLKGIETNNSKFFRILIVDDDINIQTLLDLDLYDEGYDVCHAFDGAEGCLVFDELKPHLVVLDLLMPNLVGTEVLRIMKENYPDIPIIIFTAYDYRDDFALWALDAYIVKQSDIEELSYTIDKLILQYYKDKK